MVVLNPYLSFQGNAREALALYQSVFGGDVQIMTFSSVPGTQHEESEADNVMHGQLTAPGGITLMGADTPIGMQAETPVGVAVSLSGPQDELEKLRGWFDQLSEGGTVIVPMETAPWGDTFGMALDRFGIQWLVNVAA